MSNQQAYMIFYLVLIVAGGAGEYLHLLPIGTLNLLLGGVLVHGVTVQVVSNGKTPPPPPPVPPTGGGA